MNCVSMDNHSKEVTFPAFKINVVQRVKKTTKDHRKKLLNDCSYNLFKIPSEEVMVDFLTDSGTGSLSNEQMAKMQLGDESYASSKSWYKFRDAVTELFNFKHVIPTHQGRAAERILFTTTVNPDMIVPNNTHFDTTRANIELRGGKACDIPIEEARDPKTLHPFKGMLCKLFLHKRRETLEAARKALKPSP